MIDDPLNISVEIQGVETTLPVLKTENPIQVQIAESSVEPNKDKNGHNWRLVCSTVEPLTALDERVVPPNFKLFMTIALQPRPDSKDPDAFKRQIGETVDALLGTDKTTRPNFSMAVVNDVIGKVAMAQLVNEEYPAGSGNWSTKIRRLKPMA